MYLVLWCKEAYALFACIILSSHEAHSEGITLLFVEGHRTAFWFARLLLIYLCTSMQMHRIQCNSKKLRPLHQHSGWSKGGGKFTPLLLESLLTLLYPDAHPESLQNYGVCVRFLPFLYPFCLWNHKWPSKKHWYYIYKILGQAGTCELWNMLLIFALVLREQTAFILCIHRLF